MKRIISLILSCAFILSISLISAGAYEGDMGVMRRAPTCADCGGATYLGHYTGQENVTSCPKNSRKIHGIAVNGMAYLCGECGSYNGADQSQSTGIRFCNNDPICFRPVTVW